jgi:hypothetical protein
VDSNDLKLLKRDELRGSQYIELAFENAKQWASDSVYLKDDLFAALFNPEFEQANPNFSFFGTAQFSAQQLDQLVIYLEANESELDAIKSYESFIRFVSRPGVSYRMEPLLLRQFPNLKEIWPQILAKYKSLNLEIANLIKLTRASGRSFRVNGL